MAELLKRTWQLDPARGLSRKDRRPCEYEVYLPDPISGREFEFESGVAADLTDAERAVVHLNQEGGTLADTEAMARLLLRTESVASSKIEGLAVGSRRLFKAQLAGELGVDTADRGAAEVLNNIMVMERLVELAGTSPLTPERLLETHALLMRGTRFEHLAGMFRKQQNWIGGGEFNPCAAEFVPPPPEMVANLIGDLCDFTERDDLPAVAQAAIAHAQFETVHPFFDGNGRIGRAIIQVILRGRGLAPRIVPPVSLVLATLSRDYVRGLSATRYVGAPGGQDAIAGLNRWLGTFAAAVTRSASEARAYDSEVKKIQERWRARLGKVRRGSVADLLIEALPAAPVLTVKTASGLVGRSSQAVNEAMPRLTEAKVLSQTTVGRRNRAFEATELIDAFNDLERRLTSPEAAGLGR